jgi:cell division protein FtsQ
VLEAPEERHGSESGRPRRGAASTDRRLRRDLSEDFAEPYDDDFAPAGRRRGGVRIRFRGLPKTKWGRIIAGVLLLLCLGLGLALYLMARSFLLHDERFVIQSSSSIEFEGNTHVTRAQLLGIFGEDVERNIFTVSLEQRKAELEKLPWVAHATVMRLLPNRMRVSVVERTPVAFVRQGSHIGLVDASGVLLDIPIDASHEEHYSFPVVTGISASDPQSTRAARMKIYDRFTSELDSSGEKISQDLSEVDLSNPEDVKALIPDHSSDILVHFGDQDFLDRYRRFKEHLPEWRAVYPKLSSVDMRYERQVVLEMQPGAGVPVSSSPSSNATASGDAGSPSAAASAAASDFSKPVVKPKVRPVVKAAAKPVSKAPVLAAKRDLAPKATPKAAAKVPEHVTAQSEVAFDAPAAKKKIVSKGKKPAAPAKRHPVVVKPSGETTHYHPPQVVHP